MDLETLKQTWHTDDAAHAPAKDAAHVAAIIRQGADAQLQRVLAHLRRSLASLLLSLLLFSLLYLTMSEGFTEPGDTLRGYGMGMGFLVLTLLGLAWVYGQTAVSPTDASLHAHLRALQRRLRRGRALELGTLAGLPVLLFLLARGIAGDRLPPLTAPGTLWLLLPALLLLAGIGAIVWRRYARPLRTVAAYLQQLEEVRAADEARYP